MLANWRASKQPLPELCAENGVFGGSLRYWADRHPQPAPIRPVELARPGRATPEPLRLTLDGMVIDMPDGLNDQTFARILAAVGTC